MALQEMGLSDFVSKDSGGRMPQENLQSLKAFISAKRGPRKERHEGSLEEQLERACATLPTDIGIAFKKFVNQISQTRFLYPDGSPKPDWVMTGHDRLDYARRAAKEKTGLEPGSHSGRGMGMTHATLMDATRNMMSLDKFDDALQSVIYRTTRKVVEQIEPEQAWRGMLMLWKNRMDRREKEWNGRWEPFFDVVWRAVFEALDYDAERGRLSRAMHFELRDMLEDVASDVASDAELMALAIVAERGPAIKHDTEVAPRAAWEVWQKGYALLGVKDGKLQVYSAKHWPNFEGQ